MEYCAVERENKGQSVSQSLTSDSWEVAAEYCGNSPSRAAVAGQRRARFVKCPPCNDVCKLRRAILIEALKGA
jgi:hypothetical protein